MCKAPAKINMSDTAVLQREWNKKPFSDRISTLLTKSKLKSMQNLNVLGKSTARGRLSFFFKGEKEAATTDLM